MAFWKYGGIYTSDGYTTIPISSAVDCGYTCNCGFGGCGPKVDDGKVVWTDTDVIKYYNGSSVQTLDASTSTSPSVYNYMPTIENDLIVWAGRESTANHYIYYYDGSNILQIADSSSSTYFSGISIDNTSTTSDFLFSWARAGSSGTSRIFYYGGLVTEIVEPLVYVDNCSATYVATGDIPVISDGIIAYIGSLNHDVCIFDIDEQEDSIVSLDSSIEDSEYYTDVSIYLNNIAWSKTAQDTEGEVSGAYLYNLDTEEVLSFPYNSSTRGTQISNSNIVWRSGRVADSATFWDIYLWDGNKNYLLWNEGFAGEPQVGLNAITWRDQNTNALYMVKRNL